MSRGSTVALRKTFAAEYHNAPQFVEEPLASVPGHSIFLWDACVNESRSDHAGHTFCGCLLWSTIETFDFHTIHGETVLSGPLNYRPEANVMIIGVGLMGQHLATHVIDWLAPKKVVLVDHSPHIAVGTEKTTLVEFAAGISGASSRDTEVVAETVDVTDENEVRQLFERHPQINYLQHTAGISPKPLTPPEDLTKEDVLGACEVNLWGAHNVIKQGINHGGFAPQARGVMILSTSATVGAEGRASAAYEESKGGLLNLLKLQSRHFVETHGLILNGLAPSPLRGPMAAQNEVSAGRLQDVEDAMPMGSLTAPKHISAATMFFWSDDCWCVGELLTTDGGYTKHKPIYGPLHS